MTKTIEAHMRMEERFEAMNLVFGDNPKLKEQILKAIEHAKEKCNKKPFIYEKISNDRPDIQSIYVEFQDDYHREAGEFFDIILDELGIECEKDVMR